MIRMHYWDLRGCSKILKNRPGWYIKSSVLFGDSFFMIFFSYFTKYFENTGF